MAATNITKKTNFITRDWLAKLLCLLAAVLVWVYVMQTESIDFEKDYTAIPVTLQNSSKLTNDYGLTVINGTGNTVDITIKGKKSEISRYGSDDFKAYADLSGITAAGVYPLNISYSVPTGLSVVKTTQDAVSVTVDSVETRMLHVQVHNIEEVYDSAYERGTITFDPSTVTVKGPASVIETLDYAGVDLSLGKLTQSVTASASVILVNKDGDTVKNQYVTLTATQVTASVPLYAYKDVPLAVDYKYGYLNEENCDITITPASVRLRGDPALLAGIDELKITTIDEKKNGMDSTVKATIITPDGVTNTSEATAATVTIRHKNTVTKDIAVSNIFVMNPNSVKYVLPEEAITVTLRGESNAISEITADNITATITIDYTAGVGNVTVPVAIEFDDKYDGHVYETGEYYIRVTVS